MKIRVLMGMGMVVGLAAASAEPTGNATVFIVSLDGIRSDYIDRSDTPFIDGLMKDGAWSLQMRPAFPTLTFTTHTTLATGTPAEKHGVTGNRFYDTRTQETLTFPGDSALLEAEPIWTTAARQGVRVLVLDWVLAHQQTGPNATAYFGQEYARGISDEERIQRVLDRWADDASEVPLRLVMAYGESPDKEGHRYGPDAEELNTTMAEADTLLQSTFDQAYALWNRQKQDGDSFYFILVSDHGMSKVNQVGHLPQLAGQMGREDIGFVTGGNVGHIFLDQVAETERGKLAEEILKNLREHEFLRAYPRNEIPEEWGLRHPYRTGDIFVSLDKGYALTGRPLTGVMPYSGQFGPLGMHGYDPVTNPEMETVFITQRFPESLGKGDLGPILSKQVHATMAAILGVEPSPEADPNALLLTADGKE